MDPGSIANNIGGQVTTVWNAPIPFLAVVIAAILVIWWLVRREYETRLSNADSTQKLLERQVADYKDKLSGATPEEAKERIDTLETQLNDVMAQLAAIAPRSITPAQAHAMKAVLEPLPGGLVLVAYDAAVGDAGAFSATLANIFKMAGWRAIRPLVMGIPDPPASGIGVRIPDPANPTTEQTTIIAALEAAGLEFDVQAELLRPESKGQEQPAAEIILTHRAN